MTTPSTEPETTRALFRGLAGAALFTGGLYAALTATSTAMFLPDIPLAGDARGAAFLSIVGGVALAFLGWRLGMPALSREGEGQALTAPAAPAAAPDPSSELLPVQEPERKKTFPPPAPSGEEVAWRWEGTEGKPQPAAVSTTDIEPPRPPLPPKRGMPWKDSQQ